MLVFVVSVKENYYALNVSINVTYRKEEKRRYYCRYFYVFIVQPVGVRISTFVIFKNSIS